MLALDVGYPLVRSSSLERARRSIVLLDTLSVRKKEMYFLFESSSRSRFRRPVTPFTFPSPHSTRIKINPAGRMEGGPRRFAIALDPSAYSLGSGITARLHVHAPEMPRLLPFTPVRQRRDNVEELIGVKSRSPTWSDRELRALCRAFAASEFRWRYFSRLL